MMMKQKQADKLKEEAAEKHDEWAALEEDIELPIKLDAGGQLPGNVVQLRDVSFGYPDCPTLFANVEVSARRREGRGGG